MLEANLLDKFWSHVARETGKHVWYTSIFACAKTSQSACFTLPRFWAHSTIDDLTMLLSILPDKDTHQKTHVVKVLLFLFQNVRSAPWRSTG